MPHTAFATQCSASNADNSCSATEIRLPPIIQGGMGVAVSDWRLARAVSSRGMLGVVSGTGLDQVFARRLQHGDSDGELRAAIAEFPCQVTAKRTLERFFNPNGKAADKPYKTPPMFRLDSPKEHQAFCALSAFVEVWLAKRGHNGPVGINVLEKIAMPNPSLLFGAMLAGVDYVLMGAGIPWQIPGILDLYAQCKPVVLKVAVEDDPTNEGAELPFDPAWVLGDRVMELRRPKFLAIVSFATLAQSLMKRATGAIDGFVVEAHIAGGHNAPPRGPLRLNERGEPIYGERDEIDLSKFKALGLPFWVAGGQMSPGALQAAQEQGAVGIQAGTLFAFCRESGVDPELRRRVLETVKSGQLSIYTDPNASPTGFPFKVVGLEGTLSERTEYLQRNRVCDAGYLRRVCRLPDGTLGYRCPGEQPEDYVAKGGKLEDTVGRKCLCNGLLSNIGLPQRRHGNTLEKALLTAGDDLVHLGEIVGDKLMDYSANDAIDLLLGADAAHA